MMLDCPPRKVLHYWSNAALISGSAWWHCLNTNGGGSFLCWCGRCRHISPMTPGDSAFLVKLSSTSALPYSKAPLSMYNDQYSIFCWCWTHMSILTEMGHGLHMDLPWHCGFLDKSKGLLLVKGCSFQILLETPPIVSVHLWLPAVCCAQIFKPNVGYLGCLKIREDNNRVALNVMVSVLPGVKPGSSLPPMERITCL